MADNITIKDGGGSNVVVAAKDVSSVFYSKVLVSKADGTPVDPVAAVGGGVPVVNSSGEYEPVAASQSTQTIGATGATGDYLSGVLIVPANLNPGAVSIKDGADTAITIFTGGTASVSNLVPFYVPVGAVSRTGAWQITTGASVSAFATGNFT